MLPARGAAVDAGSRDTGAGGVGMSCPSELAAPVDLVAGVNTLSSSDTSRLFSSCPAVVVAGVCDAAGAAGESGGSGARLPKGPMYRQRGRKLPTQQASYLSVQVSAILENSSSV